MSLSFSARLSAGDVLHIWQKPVDAAARSHVELCEAGGNSVLAGLPSDDFQMVAHAVTKSGEVSVIWNEANTLVSLAYAFGADVRERGIRVLFTTGQNSPAAKRHRLHLAPPFGWMNDPNGMVEIAGRTHGFYQHYPHARRWNTMHWGHAVSDNMVDWTHFPVFLHPQSQMLADPVRKGGAFSGSAIANGDGTLRIFHTDREDSREPEQEWQMTAVSGDLLSVNSPSVVINQRPPLPGFGKDLRDPYVFKGPDGLWKMVLGGNDEAAALVLLYETEDATAATGWRFASVLHREPLPRSVPAECPCVIALDGEGEGLHVLVFGLIGHQSLVKGRLNPSFALAGRFDGKRFEEIARRELDFVGDAYAFQAFMHAGRPVGLAWAANWADVRRAQDFPSAMTFPRRLVWKDGALFMPPVETVAELRREKLASSMEDLQRGIAIPEGLAEISFTVRDGAPFRLALSHPDFPVTLLFSGKVLEFEGDWMRPRARGVRYVVETPSPKHIQLFIDVGLIEIYVDGGRWSGTKRVDSDQPVSMIKLDAANNAIGSAEVWHLRPQTGAPRER